MPIDTMYYTDYPQVYLNTTTPLNSTRIIREACLTHIKDTLLAYNIDFIPSGCVLIYMDSREPTGCVFFSLLSDVKVGELLTPRGRRVFVEAGSCVNYLGHQYDAKSGFPTEGVRLPYIDEVERYTKLNTI